MLHGVSLARVLTSACPGRRGAPCACAADHYAAHGAACSSCLLTSDRQSVLAGCYGYAHEYCCAACPASTQAPAGSTSLAQCGPVTLPVTCAADHYAAHGHPCASCSHTSDVKSILAGCYGYKNAYCCAACPANTQSTAGATSSSRCTAKPGYFGSPGHAASRCTTSCPANTYRTGSCGGTSNYACNACPTHAHSAAGAIGEANCLCDPGFYYAALAGATGTLRCEAFVACDAKTQWQLDWAGSATKGSPTKIGRRWRCGTCPAHSDIPDSSATKTICEDDQWKATNGVTCLLLGAIKACTASGGLTSSWKGRWGDMDDLKDAHGVTAAVGCCSCGGGSKRQGLDVDSCQCTAGYYDSNFHGGVTCEGNPARIKNTNDTPCNILGMGFAMKTEVTMGATNRQSAQLGVMTSSMKDVDLKPGAKLSKANFDDACLQFFTQADRPGGVDALCGFKIELFAKGTGTGSPELLGTARLDCDGRSGLYALMHTCTSTCMNDHAAVCCFVPKAVAWQFPCCRAELGSRIWGKKNGFPPPEKNELVFF